MKESQPWATGPSLGLLCSHYGERSLLDMPLWSWLQPQAGPGTLLGHPSWGREDALVETEGQGQGGRQDPGVASFMKSEERRCEREGLGTTASTATHKVELPSGGLRRVARLLATMPWGTWLGLQGRSSQHRTGALRAGQCCPVPGAGNEGCSSDLTPASVGTWPGGQLLSL